MNKLLVLVVDDDPVQRFVAQKQLQRFGLDSMVATNGQQAVAVAELHTFDLILMDVQMPVMDGLEATIAIRASVTKKNTHTPIIAVTANPDREQCVLAGMSDYLFKPVVLEELQTILNKWILDKAG